jgi:hypothetical protein
MGCWRRRKLLRKKGEWCLRRLAFGSVKRPRQPLWSTISVFCQLYPLLSLPFRHDGTLWVQSDDVQVCWACCSLLAFSVFWLCSCMSLAALAQSFFLLSFASVRFSCHASTMPTNPVSPIAWMISLSFSFSFRGVACSSRFVSVAELYLFLSLPPLHSPSGKLIQIEYALNAVASGSTSIGIRGWNGKGKRSGDCPSANQLSFRPRWCRDCHGKEVSLHPGGGFIAAQGDRHSRATTHRSLMSLSPIFFFSFGYDGGFQVSKLTDHIGLVYSGVGPDSRLVTRPTPHPAHTSFFFSLTGEP